MPYFSTYLGHISREETRCHISIRQMRDRMKKIRNPALFVPEPQCMRSSLLPFDDFCQCSWLIVHPRHHTADVDELPADMMSFRAGIANLFAPSKKESIFTGIMNMPMKHIAVFIIISPMKRDEVMARLKSEGVSCSILHCRNDIYTGFIRVVKYLTKNNVRYCVKVPKTV